MTPDDPLKLRASGGQDMPDRRPIALRAAAGDAAVAILVAALVALSFDDRSLLDWPASDVVFALLGLGLLGSLVAWRAYRHNVAVLAGAAAWYRPILEGFAWGFLVPFVWLLVYAAGTAFAAGTPYDGAAEWGLSEWLQYVAIAAGIALQTAAVGGVFGAALAVVNRVLLKIVA